MTLAYSIKVQIKGNLKNSSHLSVSFYNVNERNKNFFFNILNICREISVYYFDNFQSDNRIFLIYLIIS